MKFEYLMLGYLCFVVGRFCRWVIQEELQDRKQRCPVKSTLSS